MHFFQIFFQNFFHKSIVYILNRSVSDNQSLPDLCHLAANSEHQYKRFSLGITSSLNNAPQELPILKKLLQKIND